MLLTLFLLHAFHIETSVCLGLLRFEIEAVNYDYLKISIGIVGSKMDQMSGNFTVIHKDCPKRQCGSSTEGLPIAQGQNITIKTNLSPCKNYSGIQVRALNKNASAHYWFWNKSWTAVDCSLPTTKPTSG